MPSTKPTIMIRTEDEIISKIKIIANEHNRSMSKEIELLIKNHIKNYETENGVIKF